MQVLADDMANDLEQGHAESASLLTLQEFRENHTFVADLHIPAFGSGVVALAGGRFGAYITRIHVGGDSFVSSTDAAASHDSIILNKDDLRPRVQNYLNVNGCQLCLASLNELYEEKLQCHRVRCVAVGIRFDMIYTSVHKQEIMVRRSGTPFHMSLDDHVRNLGADRSGRALSLAVGSCGCVFDLPIVVPSELESLYGEKRPGRGVRKYDVSGSEFGAWVDAIGLGVPDHLRLSRARIHVYIAQFNRKG